MMNILKRILGRWKRKSASEILRDRVNECARLLWQSGRTPDLIRASSNTLLFIGWGESIMLDKILTPFSMLKVEVDQTIPFGAFYILEADES